MVSVLEVTLFRFSSEWIPKGSEAETDPRRLFSLRVEDIVGWGVDVEVNVEVNVNVVY